MELMLILRMLRRRWWLVAVPTLIVAAVAIPDLLSSGRTAAGGFTTTIRYSAAQVLAAIPDRKGDYQDVWLASELAVNAMTDWVRTSSFVSEIVKETSAQGIEVNTATLSV